MYTQQAPVPGEKTFDLVKGTMREYSKRTKQACDRCRMKKSKCNGGYPCQTCIHRSWTCIYSARKRSDPIRWHSHMQEITEEALQRLYKLCEDANIFPGEPLQNQERGVTTECILRAMGFTVDSQPDDINHQESPHGLCETPTELEPPDDAMSIFEIENDAWSQSWSASDGEVPTSYFEQQTPTTQPVHAHPKPKIGSTWNASRSIHSQTSTPPTVSSSLYQPTKMIDSLVYRSDIQTVDHINMGESLASTAGQMHLDFGDVFGFDPILMATG